MLTNVAFDMCCYALLIWSYQVGPDVKEVLDTFRVAAELGSETLGAYVISMASSV